VIRSLALFGALAAFAQAQETLWVLEKQNDSVTVYDYANAKPLTTIKVGARPHEFALSLDGKRMFVTNYGVNSYTQTEPGGNTISIIDVASRKVVDQIDLGEYHRPHGIELDREGRLYVTTDFPASLLIIDGEEKKILARLDPAQKLPHMVQLSRDEKKAYVANAGSGSVSVLSLKDRRLMKTVEVGGVPMGLALTNNGDRLFVTTRDQNQIAVIDTKKDEVIKRVEVKGGPGRVRLTPDGRFLISSLILSGEMAVIDTKTYAEKTRIAAGKAAEGLYIDATGKRGYISAQGDDEVLEYSITDFKPLRRIKTAARPDPVLVLRAH
jgi:YVTN family beta-propeller protein